MPSLPGPEHKLYLIQELDLAVNAVKSGLAVLQLSRPYHTQHFLFLLALSTGIERLLKVMLCLYEFDRTGAFLSAGELRTYGHDVTRLLGAVAETCYSTRPVLSPIIVEDRAFLVGDALLEAVLDVLTDFAKRDRYLFMDGLSSPSRTDEWMDRRWERIEAMTMPEGKGRRLALDGRLDEVKAYATRCIVACLERFLRALARTVTHTDRGADTLSLGSGLWDFLVVRDERLGETVYQVVNP